VGGDYTLTINFDDDDHEAIDFTETVTETLDVVTVTPVETSSMQFVIHADGALKLIWDLPSGVTNQM
jgi:hypothetical protein